MVSKSRYKDDNSASQPVARKKIGVTWLRWRFQGSCLYRSNTWAKLTSRKIHSDSGGAALDRGAVGAGMIYPFGCVRCLKKRFHVHLRHAVQAETTGRPRMYVVVGPGYPIVVSGKSIRAGYPGRGKTVVLRWRNQGIIGIPRVANHADRSVGVA